jgi:aminoglycoside phosphotransferase (APT) family kinase protein
LGPDDVSVLGDLLEQGNAIERRWDDVEAFCSTMTGTLSHGDLKPKNVRVRPGASGIVILVLDWEMAGWAVPAADLECYADLAVYGSVVNALGMRIAKRDLEMLAVYGRNCSYDCIRQMG